MNNMKEHEFLDFIKRKGRQSILNPLAELAGACDVVQIVNKQPQYCDIAIGMRKDDDAKLVYVGKKHFNFGRGGNFPFLAYQGDKRKTSSSRTRSKTTSRTRRCSTRTTSSVSCGGM